jgi:aldose 1-epimerase
MSWTLRSVETTRAGGVRALLSLEHDAVSVLYEVTVGRTLTMTLSLRNTGAEPRLVEAALHTYVAVHDVTACVLTGLEGADYTEAGASGRQTGPVRVTGPIDRMYRSQAPVRVTDPGNDRMIVVTGTGSPTTVVWNPWSRGAAELADLADDEFASFVCVETAAARRDAPVIEPGASWSMSAAIAVEAL